MNLHDYSNILITSDTHAFHKNIVRGVSEWSSGYRDFNTIDEMNSVIYDTMNQAQPNDLILHLGDWSFGGVDKIEKFRKKVQCKNIVLVYGNHDHNIRKDYSKKSLFVLCTDYLSLKYKGKNLVLFHYPIASWEGIGRGAIHFHGHCHGNYAPQGKMHDVGLDNNEMRILTLDEAIQIADSRPLLKVDHH